MWSSVSMNNSMGNDMLVNANLANGDQYHAMLAHEMQTAWSPSSEEFKNSSGYPGSMSYQSFDWAPVNNSNDQYTSPLMGSSASSYEAIARDMSMTGTDCHAYQDEDLYSNSSNYVVSQYGSSSAEAHVLRKDTPKASNRRPTNSRKTSDQRTGPQSTPQMSLDVPKKQKLQRTNSDKSSSGVQPTSSPGDKSSGSMTGANEAHIIAERRYRNNLNAKIAQIQTALQDARFRSHSNETYRSRGGTYFNPETGSQEPDATSPGSAGGKDRRRKADILDEAAEYIRYADLELRHLSEEVQWLNRALAASQGDQHYNPRHHQQ